MKVAISLSGGLDSAVLLAHVLQTVDGRNEDILAVGFCYGSRHNPHENRAAAAVASHYDVSFKMIDLTTAMKDFKSALIPGGEALPEGHYQEESMRQTVVPGRNLIFISILAGLAESLGLHAIYLGVHSGDHFIYPDCRPQFVAAARQVISYSTDGKVGLATPFMNMDKRMIVEHGRELCVPFELTRTCYSDHSVACGKCGSCQERLEAFYLAGMMDPLYYQTRELFPKQS